MLPIAQSPHQIKTNGIINGLPSPNPKNQNDMHITNSDNTKSIPSKFSDYRYTNFRCETIILVHIRCNKTLGELGHFQVTLVISFLGQFRSFRR